jgi:hypothetical protein
VRELRLVDMDNPGTREVVELLKGECEMAAMCRDASATGTQPDVKSDRTILLTRHRLLE